MSDTAGVTTGREGMPSRPERGGERRGLFARIALFFRQVLDQMSKVVWPTRTELLGYFAVVLVFVVAIMAYVGVLDVAFARLMLWVFG